MENGRISVEVPALSSSIQRFQEGMHQFSESQNRMIASVQELNEMWTGQAKEIFLQQFEADCVVLNDVQLVLQEMAEAMEYAWNQYQNCDSDVMAAVSEIRIG